MISEFGYYAAYHFHRTAPYGVIANLLAMPVVSAEVMPMGILGVVASPFGFDAICWRLMGAGIDWMITVVLWVTALPGAVGRIQAFGTGPLLLGTAAILLLCLLRTPLRWSGAVLAVAASLWAVTSPRPDVLVSGDGQAAAIRGQDGRLAVLHSNRDSFAIKEWLAADGDARTVKDATLHDGVQCDAAGCIGRLTDGRLVSEALSAEAFAEDCTRTAVVVSPREAPGDCAATADRPQGLARRRRHRSALDRRPFRVQRRAAARLRAALGEGLVRFRAIGARGATGRAECDAVSRRSGRGRLIGIANTHRAQRDADRCGIDAPPPSK